MIVVFSASLILLSACSLADDAAPSSSDQPDPFSEKDRKAGDRVVKVVNNVEFAFRWCPPGTFMMGSPESEEGRKDDEQQHQVTLTKGFWMMETEVTQEQWKAIMKNNPIKYVNDQNDKYPIQFVSWDDSQLFCQKCTELGFPVQLPTEAQWEYACRAGTTEAFAGNIDDVGWYKGGIHTVRMKMPNNWGLYDMHGNLYEFCSDWYGSYPHKSVTDPEGPSSGLRRVMRGGGYGTADEKFCRSANRSKCVSDLKNDTIGFRCVIGKGVPSTYFPQGAAANPKSSITRIGKFGQGTKPGERKTAIINGVEFAFRWCPPGTFMMGSPESEQKRNDNETQHQVTLTKGFWMLETEVTQEQWTVIMNHNPSSFQWGKLPVGRVSWDSCQKFCQKCNELGLPVQLPTEAQWEYACRAGTTEAVAGNLDEMGWYKSNSGNRIHPVGKKKPNAWGLYDMTGNICEWCQDWYGDYPSESVTDPVGPPEGTNRIYRDSSWMSEASSCRSARRSSITPLCNNLNSIGARVIISLDLESSMIEENEKKEQEAVVTQDYFGNGEKPGDRKIVEINGVEFAFRWCPPGTFMMGSPEDEQWHNEYEILHKVTLTKGFWMLETEVTVGMFKAFVNETGYESKGGTPIGWTGSSWWINSQFSWRNPGFNQDDTHPVTCICWGDAEEFCKWLGRKIGQNVMPPTEAQWEYACRAGTTEKFAGDLDEMAWYSRNSEGKTHPVGTKKANSWGLYDMHGNVQEWCRDLYWYNWYWYCKDPSSGNAIDPMGPASGSDRIIRGSSWDSSSWSCRSAYRSKGGVGDRTCTLGFRCAFSSGSASKSSKTKASPSTGEKEELVNQNTNEDNKKAGTREVVTIKGVEFAFRWCPPGTFMMGSPESEEGRYKNETQRKVTLTQGFWMLETEVTQKQWEAIMDYNNSDFKGDKNHPVEHICWDECQTFCIKCKELGLSVRLPSEEQWEYACRAGSTTAYFWGNALNGDKANCKGNDPCGTTTTGKYIGHTTPVGSYEPNAWGLYDMHGNVYEWCQDSYTDSLSPSDMNRRVLRGGTWNNKARNCRSAFRQGCYHGLMIGFIGFRVIKDE